jgi:hypothetical protein
MNSSLSVKVLQIITDNAPIQHDKLKERLQQQQQQHEVDNDTELLQIINHLISNYYIELLKDSSSGAVLYNPIKEDHRRTLAQLQSKEEVIVYNLIKSTESRGVWIKDLLQDSGLARVQLNKILKQMELKQYIKTVKSNSGGGNSKKKLYLLQEYQLEDSESMMAGYVFYTNGEVDVAMVSTLYNTILQYIQKRFYSGSSSSGSNSKFVPKEDILQFLNNANILTTTLEDQDLNILLTSMEYERLIYKDIVHNGYYILTGSGTDSNSRQVEYLSEIPCAKCTQYKYCSVKSDYVNARKCEYFQQWMDL